MSNTEMTTGKKKDDKKPQISVKLEWIFGIRKDIIPNVLFIDKETLIYPASNYIVIFNFTRKMGPLNLQHYIAGQPHSKGITTFTTPVTSLSKKIIGFSEDLDDGILISFYQLTNRAGFKNNPVKQNSFNFPDEKLTHTYCMAFSRRRKDDNYILALASNDKSYYFIIWKWDLDNVKDQPFVQQVTLHETRSNRAEDDGAGDNKNDISSSNSASMKEEPLEGEGNMQETENPDLYKDEPIEVNTKNHFEIAFTSSMENDTFSLVSDYSVSFFTISYNLSEKKVEVRPKTVENKADKDKEEEEDRIDLINKNGKMEYGSIIYGSNWLYDGSFCLITDKYINVFDGKDKKNPQKIENPDSCITLVTPYSLSNTSFDGFIAAGKNKTMQFYAKKSQEENILTDSSPGEKNPEKYELLYEKTKYDFVPGVNEKITDDKVLQNEKISSNDRQFNFLSVIALDDDPLFCIATTSNNDLMQINTEEKEIDRALIKYLISPFHSDSVEGMDICINKPYLITCSRDKSVRVWDYQQKIHVISKIFDEALHSVAYHPSGMHALVSADDKILPLNIFYDEIDSMAQNIGTKSKSKDIKFSNMGHLFAFDSGAVVQIYDFLNMQILCGPPPSGPQKKNFSITSARINYLDWSEDDKHILASGNDYIYDWEIKYEHETRPKLPQTNVTSAVYIDKNKSLIASTDDKCLRKLTKDGTEYTNVQSFKYPMNELHAFKKSKLVICATTRTVTNPENAPPESNANSNASNFSTCLRIFPEINKNYEFMDIPSHQGKTTRVRFNFQENKIFTCGEDGCLNIYSIEIPFDSNESEKYISDQNSTFTNTVLIKRGEFKIREFNKKELPAKRDEKLKKIRSENQDKRDADKKALDDKKNKISNTRHKEKSKLEQMKKELNDAELEFNDKIKKEIQNNETEHETKFNENQIELSLKTRDVESIRNNIKTEKDKHKADVKKINDEAKLFKQRDQEIFEAKKKDLKGNEMELDGKIKFLEENQKEDDAALDWLNKEVITEIKENIDELRHKIDELKVHYNHHIKKQGEELEKLKAQGDSLKLELKKIEEERDRQQITKKKNEENKKKAEEELIKMTKRISEIENKIIECKKAHTYLEKCKFVLSYKIQELKKEAGPMEKVLEDLQLRTKEDELSLSKYNREFEIIEQKLVNLEDLKEKTKTHEKTEHDLKNEINAFKIDLFNMLPFIDDYDKLREGFRNMRDKYLKTYVPEFQDHELESEFSNQKSKMKNRVLELQSTLNTLKQQHKENIFENRYKNNEMIQKIELLKESIKKTKKENETKNGDQKHANAVAEIFASQAVKKLMMENISIKDKIQVFEEKIKAKKEELSYLKKNVKIEHVYLSDGYNVNEDQNEGDSNNNNNNNNNQEDNE